MAAAEILIDTFRLFARKLIASSLNSFAGIRRDEAVAVFRRKLAEKCACFERFAPGFEGCGEEYLLELHLIADHAVAEFFRLLEKG